MIIKSTNPRFTKGLKLEGNVLSGDTYRASHNIKKYWDGKWDATRKVWIVNPEKVMTTLNDQHNWGLSIGTESDAVITTSKSAYNPANWRNADGSLNEDF